ncbi:MAG TPA: GntR family transcriptional regulator [Pyrinomonadaceae bacterium]|nr:GntR family transcriptional regulator [Pyrinomonadaceae bacterium]
MKIWLSKNSEIPIGEQLATQITLGIVSGDLPTGERIPSTRELAGRFQIHANTVGTAYRKLSEKGLIEFRKGNGFYVCEAKNRSAVSEFELDFLVAEFFRNARSRGFSRDEIEKHLHKWLAAQAPEKILVVEPDENLRAILIEEIRAATSFQVVGVGLEEFQNKCRTANAIVAAMTDEKANIESILPAGKARVFLIARSVSSSMKNETRPRENDLIAVASGWNDFLILVKTVLVAANVEADSLLLRSTKDANWQKGLKDASMIICDSLTAKEFGGDERVRSFRLISDGSLNELQDFTRK